ncbi:laglidadg endonuclease (mitochondrion) [Neurospora crassa OR74A]|uniref:ATP synthase subunit a n=6 Tax=cellular organisms TaxID=131567 RepID=M1RV38_NEUCR|nr:laglidadg endonuclease [Neurospora crassa OR74A]AGG16015.1 laglidadg endonuclease [Neurospora crassa OR74A]QUB01645.1 laglidadg endonuclease [Neurospora crassa]|eukprot:YP_009126727.1 laglidadg endonuclease (mitochondrion) [Neurospora crassa OR74A]
MSTLSFNNISTEVLSPLNQFEIRDLLSIDALGNLHISITNIGFYLTIGAFFFLVINLLSINYNRLVSNSWSISQESLYATIHSIVTSQINPRNGQIYFPFIYTLFIFILINNLIGMVNRSLCILSLFISSIFGILGIHKPIFQRLSYSSLNSNSQVNTQMNISKDSPRYSFNNKNTFYLNPDYITGFVDGEGCFSLSLFKDDRRLNGWQVKPIFSISLHKKDISLLEAIQRTFKVGKIYKHGIDSIQYRVSSLKNLQIITDHFDSYPLITQKRADYLLFKQAIALIKNKEHLSLEGLLKLVGIKATLNWGLSDKFKESFPTVKAAVRPSVIYNTSDVKVKSLNWIRGFIEGEGCFQVITQNSPPRRGGWRNVWLRFSLTQHIKDEELLKDIAIYLNMGRYYKSPTRNEGQYLITIFSDINNKLIPFLKEYPLLGVKQEDFLDFVKIAKLIESKTHLTDEGLDTIKLIQSNMNSKRIIKEE